MFRNHVILALWLGVAVMATSVAAAGDRDADGDGEAAGAADAPETDGLAGDQASYRIGPGDRLAIIVFGSDALTREVLVRPDGYIDLPLAGTLARG